MGRVADVERTYFITLRQFAKLMIQMSLPPQNNARKNSIDCTGRVNLYRHAMSRVNVATVIPLVEIRRTVEDEYTQDYDTIDQSIEW